MSFNYHELAFIILEGASNASDEGVYDIQIHLMDQAKNKGDYSFTLNITCEQEEVEEVVKFPGVVILPEYEPTPNRTSLKGHIESVSLSGLTTIMFDRPVKPISNFTLIEEGEVLVNDEPKPMLEIYAVPGAYSNVEDLALDWEMVNFTSQSLTI